jgi:hypothetical protein
MKQGGASQGGAALPALLFHALGDWGQGRVTIAWEDSSYCPPSDLSMAVERAWGEAKARLGDALFDGPMCRMEGWTVSPQCLKVRLSHTSYKQFLGTNLRHGEWAGCLGRAVLANPVGVSSALLSADGRLMMGRRNACVAYYPNRIHPFAGALEPRADLNVFDEVRRELKEELNLEPGELESIHCTGIAEDESIRQPELIFRVESSLSEAEIASRLDKAEHEGVWSAPADRPSLTDLLKSPPSDFTPIALASLLCWGRAMFGDQWFFSAYGGPSATNGTTAATSGRHIPQNR